MTFPLSRSAGSTCCWGARRRSPLSGGDAVAPLIHEAMGIALVMAATYPSDVPVSVAGLDGLGELECVARALREVQSWSSAWPPTFWIWLGCAWC